MEGGFAKPESKVITEAYRGLVWGEIKILFSTTIGFLKRRIEAYRNVSERIADAYRDLAQAPRAGSNQHGQHLASRFNQARRIPCSAKAGGSRCLLAAL